MSLAIRRDASEFAEDAADLRLVDAEAVRIDAQIGRLEASIRELVRERECLRDALRIERESMQAEIKLLRGHSDHLAGELASVQGSRGWKLVLMTRKVLRAPRMIARGLFRIARLHRATQIP